MAEKSHSVHLEMYFVILTDMKNKTILAFILLLALGVLAYLVTANRAMSPAPAEVSPEEGTETISRAEDEMSDPRVADFTPKPDLITVTSLEPGAIINSPLEIRGEARGYWFFEADFPVVLTNWDGLIIAEGIATAAEPWMTEDFVPFSVTLSFTSPYTPSDPDFMARGSLILQKSNPSGLPENDDALELPVLFAPSTDGE
jgi:hypothetical protein